MSAWPEYVPSPPWLLKLQCCEVVLLRSKTNISDAKTNFGLEEYIAERLDSSSVAVWESLTITMVWPMTVIELMGPGSTMSISGRRLRVFMYLAGHHHRAPCASTSASNLAPP